MVAALLEDGPVLVLCPATLCQQWQVELKDKLGIPSAVWLSARKAWQHPDGHLIRTRGREDIRRCPYRIGIVSTGLIFRDSEERAQLLRAHLGTLVLDEAHKARRSQGIGSDGEPNRLLSFMLEAARNARHVLLGTATPIQTDVGELWDALEILNQSADHVLGRMFGLWRQCRSILPVVTGEKPVEEEHEAWQLIRNPLPPRREEPLFDYIRTDLGIADGVFFTDRPITDLDATTRTEMTDRLAGRERGTSFFQRHNPIVRHTVLRKRSTLEDRGLLDRIAVDIWPMEGQHLPMFDGQALLTSPEIDAACEAAEAFGQALAARMRGTGFMRGMLL
jgi:SNF2-related domain